MYSNVLREHVVVVVVGAEGVNGACCVCGVYVCSEGGVGGGRGYCVVVLFVVSGWCGVNVSWRPPFCLHVV